MDRVLFSAYVLETALSMAQDGDATVDLEALQAQIDLSMSVASELVSSWIHPSLKKGAKSRTAAKDVEKELQEYIRRPPRLGVGAPLPESSSVSARENARLRSRLVGNDKKRAREDGEEGTGMKDEGNEQDEGRKGESSAKKVRLDPFSVPKKKKAKAKESEATAVGTSESAAKPGKGATAAVDGSSPNGAHASSNVLVQEKEKDGSPDRPNEQSANGVTPSPLTSKKKKKKRKRKQAEALEATDEGAGPSGFNGTSNGIPNEVPYDEAAVDRDDDEECGEEWTGFDSSMLDSVDTGHDREKPQGSLSSPSKESEIAASTKDKSAPAALHISPSRVGPPLLNLHGPPLSDAEDNAYQSPVSSKKRRRRRKKNKFLGNNGT